MAFRLVNKDRMMKPRKCLICETHPGHRVVDTGYNLTAATVFDKLRGRKYVCEGCGEKVGKAFGMIPHSRANALKEQLIAAQARIEELTEQAVMAEQLVKLTDYLNSQNAVEQES